MKKISIIEDKKTTALAFKPHLARRHSLEGLKLYLKPKSLKPIQKKREILKSPQSPHRYSLKGGSC